ncbi:hypothetical protein CEXT_272161 [Caerostris extrusa]|uniref:Uncharacterized protein n=1 Tax=Caerostris extrusa TaxID=172846 RepID=A0AAV4VUL5_CAEEX|nr:hypothetical protein CEXT_272161 [Caerostris extrusa]
MKTQSDLWRNEKELKRGREGCNKKKRKRRSERNAVLAPYLNNVVSFSIFPLAPLPQLNSVSENRNPAKSFAPPEMKCGNAKPSNGKRKTDFQIQKRAAVAISVKEIDNRRKCRFHHSPSQSRSRLFSVKGLCCLPSLFF